MVIRAILATLSATALLAACSPAGPDPAAATDWVGTITADGDVTTVVNQAGSVWGGAARLVEESSIGVEAGADPYMFGRVVAVWATAERTFVLDLQIPVVRVYDVAGNHLLDVGRQGQGPGEFTFPADLAVTPDGNILVIDRTMQVQEFGADGEPRATWRSAGAYEVGFGNVWVLGDGVLPWVPTFDPETQRVGQVATGPDGPIGEAVYLREAPVWNQDCLTYVREGRDRSFCEVPYRPGPVMTFIPAAKWVTGTSDAYRFQVYDSGPETLVVERAWDPVVLTEDERDYHRRVIIETIRERGDPGWSWRGPEIATHKPAYQAFRPDQTGRLWVQREMASRRSTMCPDGASECWLAEGYALDAFGSDGRFLGSVSLPRAPVAPLFIGEDTLVAAVADETGLVTVKRYRLVLPDEAG